MTGIKNKFLKIFNVYKIKKYTTECNTILDLCESELKKWDRFDKYGGSVVNEKRK